jgi:hypothetical protein
VAQNPAVSTKTPIVKSGTVSAAPQARLILQDPSAFDQATQPALRSSLELSIEPSAAAMDREKARDLWESLSLEPEVAQERQAERKRLLMRTDMQARESAAAQAKAIELQAQLAKAREERFNHPLVYAGAAGLVGVGVLWLMERRKRVALQERELDALSAQTPHFMRDEQEARAAKASVNLASSEDANSYLPQQGAAFSLEDSPDLADDYATDLPGLPLPEPWPDPLPEDVSDDVPELVSAPTPHELVVRPAVQAADVPSNAASKFSGEASKPPAGSVSLEQTPDWAQPKSDGIYSDSGSQDALQASERSLLALPKRVLGHLLRRRTPQDAMSTSALSHLQTEIQSSSHHSIGMPSTLIHEHAGDATQMLYDEEAQEAFEQELLAHQLGGGLHAGFSSDQANIDLLSKTRATPQHGDSIMEHLLELRTAVNGLCALGRPEGAARLLAEHIEADPGCCAWAYLEYMQICEQIGLREEFETMRKNYRQQFNRIAPYWHEPNSHVLGLDGYARAAGELCAAWALGIEHSRTTLAAWLIGPLLGRKLMQLPAYHDLFDLYEMLEYVNVAAQAHMSHSMLDESTSRFAAAGAALSSMDVPVLNRDAQILREGQDIQKDQGEQEFVPTVSLLDLDYEFSSDVTLEESEVRQAETAVTIVKTGNFSVDFNVAGTQLGALPSMPAELAKK